MSWDTARLRRICGAGLVLLFAWVAGCDTLPRDRVYSILDSTGRDHTGAGLPDGGRHSDSVSTAPAAEPDVRSRADFVLPGSGEFTAEPRRRAPAASGAVGDITLNFENTNILEVVKVILGDLLQQNYVVDPAVQGTVTLQTSRPLTRDALLPALEMMLRMHAAAVVRTGDVYQVVPRDQATQGTVAPQLGGADKPIPPGYSVRIVPLRYVAAAQMQEILTPFASAGSIVRIDPARNLLIIAGTARELANLLETISVFDVDWLAGMSVALFTPDFVDAKTLASDLEQVFGDKSEGPLAGLVRFTTIERLDALLVVSSRPEYLAKVEEWVRRLDRDTGTVGQRLYIYHMQNGKAVDLAEVLGQVFREDAEASRPLPELAPGLQGAEVRSRIDVPDFEPGGTRAAAAVKAEEAVVGQLERTEQAVAATAPAPRAPEAGVALTEGPPIKIIADEINNALLIMATAQQFRQVQTALRQLDIVPLQVLIEATIAEVTLTGELSQGLEWYFKNHIDGKSGQGQLDVGAAGLSALVPGFSYAIVDNIGQVRLVLNLLAQDSRAHIVSSPSLMVLNNQKATIRVGDQVPVTTQQQQATVSTSTVVNNIEFRDTGVLLTVTPRVNAGGLVTMEVEQEVSNVAPTEVETLTPTIQQRKITSTVAVQSGETVVLGGLIRENKTRQAQGIPGLYNLPVIGVLFGRQDDQAARTELVVMITPRAVQDATQARTITDEFRRKMRSLQPDSPPAPEEQEAADHDQAAAGAVTRPLAASGTLPRQAPAPGDPPAPTPAAAPNPEPERSWWRGLFDRLNLSWADAPPSAPETSQ